MKDTVEVAEESASAERSVEVAGNRYAITARRWTMSYLPDWWRWNATREGLGAWSISGAGSYRDVGAALNAAERALNSIVAEVAETEVSR